MKNNFLIEEDETKRSCSQVRNVNLRTLKIFSSQQSDSNNNDDKNYNQKLKPKIEEISRILRRRKSSDFNYNPLRETERELTEREEKNKEEKELQDNSNNREKVNYSNIYLFGYHNINNENRLLLPKNYSAKGNYNNTNTNNNYCYTRTNYTNTENNNNNADSKTDYYTTGRKNNFFLIHTSRTKETDRGNRDFIKESKTNYFSNTKKKLFPLNKEDFMLNFRQSKSKNKHKQKTYSNNNNIKENKSTSVPKKIFHKKRILLESASVKKKRNNNNLLYMNFTHTSNNPFTKTEHYKMLMKYRKKYPFICDPNPLLPMKFIDLPKNIINMNKKYSGVLKKENNKVFEQYFSVVGREKFSAQYQNITADTESKEEREFLKNKKNQKIINEEIVSGRQLIKEIEDNKLIANQNINSQEEKANKNKNYLKNKFIKAIIYLSTKLKYLQVDLKEILKTYRIPKYSFYYSHTRELIFAIRTKNFIKASDLLDLYKPMVLDHDYFFSTPLHWAAKLNFFEIIPKIMEYGAKIDSKDFTGDTPLIIAIKHNYLESSMILFLYMASPFVRDKDGKRPIDITTDYQVKYICQRIMEFHYKHTVRSIKNFYPGVQKDFVDFIVDELKNNMNPTALAIIKEKQDIYNRQMKKGL